VIEFPRKRALSTTIVFLGVIFVLLGVVALPKAPVEANVFFIVFGGLMVVFALPSAVARTPRFRANDKGVWFGGGAVIPWTDVKAVFESGVKVKGHQTVGIAFEFHRRSTLFRAPVEHWITAPFAVGDIDISPPDTDRSTVTASRIEAMRQAASGG